MSDAGGLAGGRSKIRSHAFVERGLSRGTQPRLTEAQASAAIRRRMIGSGASRKTREERVCALRASSTAFRCWLCGRSAPPDAQLLGLFAGVAIAACAAQRTVVGSSCRLARAMDLPRHAWPSVPSERLRLVVLGFALARFRCSSPSRRLSHHLLLQRRRWSLGDPRRCRRTCKRSAPTGASFSSAIVDGCARFGTFSSPAASRDRPMGRRARLSDRRRWRRARSRMCTFAFAHTRWCGRRVDV